MKLDVILAADALCLPLTGIGRYSYELARRLSKQEEIARLRYFSMGRWVNDPLTALDAPSPGTTTSPQIPISLRSRLAHSQLAARAFRTISPAMFGWRLRGNQRTVFHSPNYIVPPFQGKTVSTVHDLSHMLYPQFHPRARVDYLGPSLRQSLARTDHVITVSETVRQEMLERHMIQPERVTTVHLAADTVFRPLTDQMLEPVMQTLGLSAGQYCLFLGTVEPRKNVDRLLQAYEMLPQAMRREWPLVIAGGKGWNSESTHARMAAAQADGWLRYLAFVDQRWLPALYAGARLMAYPSVYEGFGLPIVEAMASGTPVLTSNTSCMPEVASGAARLVNPLDTEEIAHALSQCLSDEKWQTEAKIAGLARAARLSWDRCAKETVEVYKRLAPHAYSP